MSTYLNGRANGALVFDTFDFLVSQDIRPTVELGFMPDELASNASQTVFHYKGGSSPYRNASQFASFISGFVQLLVDRYSLETVRTWRFEVRCSIQESAGH
jgi:xylan 1,4-beta-xylosidase